MMSELDHTVDPRTDDPPCPDCETDLYVHERRGDPMAEKYICEFCGVLFDE